MPIIGGYSVLGGLSGIGELLLALGSIFMVAAFFVNKARNAIDSKTTNGMPGSRGLPVLGETISFALSPRKFFRDGFDRYGPYFRTRVMGKDLVLISGNTAATLAYCNEDAFGVKMFDPLMKLLDGFMLIQNGKEHRKNRGLIVRALSDAQLRSNVKGIAEAFDAEVKRWAENSKEVEIFFSAKRAIMTVMMNVLFGNSNIPLLEIADLVAEFEFYGKGFLAIPINLPFTTLGRAFVARENILRTLTNIIEKRRSICESETCSGVVKERMDLLQTMIDSPDPETHERADTKSIANNALVILLAALDTTASVVASVIKLLGENQRVLQKVREECKRVWGEECAIARQDVDDIAQKISNLPYLDCVIQEVMRVRAPLMGTFRYAKLDVLIPGTEFIIPKGWLVGVAHDYSFTEDKAAFPDNTKFLPERFLPEGASHGCANFKGAHFPFSKGVHMCPGGRFAVAETKIIISLLALREKWPELVGSCSTVQKQNPALEEYGGLYFRFFH